VPGRSLYSYVAIATRNNLVSGKIRFRIVIRSGCGAQICDNRSHDVRRAALGSRVTIRLHADRHQTKDANQTKRGDAQGESQFDEGKRVDPPQAEFHFL
jgi:hypothetical protein